MIVCHWQEHSPETVLPFTANGHFPIMHGTAGNHEAGGLVKSSVSKCCHGFADFWTLLR